nr:ABC transporter permease [Gemmatimonadaceae bacterium]
MTHHTAAVPALWRTVLRDPRARVGVVVLVVVTLVAILAPLLAPHDPSAQLDIVALQGRPPSWAHPLGTDTFSRDVLSRLLYGARVSLAIALVAVFLSATVGIALGVTAGYAGGAIDAVLMRLVDAALSIPRLLMIIAVVAFWGDVGIV